ncbi:MAG: response regulator [Bacteroidetes bacterium]|nr:response regulator [Bacteroidota bacterium]
MTDKIRVLIIDDNEDDYYVLSDYLKNIEGKKFNIDWSFNYKDALNEINKDIHDIYLVDYRLGVKTGIDLIKEAVQQEYEGPFILLTEKGDITIDEEAMKHGAFDYLIKGEMSSEKLERSIRYSIDRAATLKELKSKEKKYRNIFDRSSDALFVTDVQLVFTEVNAAFLSLLSCDIATLLKTKLATLIADKHLSHTLCKELETKGFIDDRQVEIWLKEKQTRQCVISATKEKDIDGNTYYQGIIHDITFIKKAERATLRAEKLAATGRLVRTLAHEVRNPINNINLACEHLLNTDTSEEHRLYLDIIHRNSNRINALINQLLNSSRPSEMQKKKTVLQTLMDEIVASDKDSFNLKNIALTMDYPSKPIIIDLDAEKITIALSNILINAAEAIDHDGGKIKILLKKDNEHAIIEITDNGSGISEENIPRLFEPYYTSKRNGIGLGLAATLNIIQSHNGSIEVISEMGKGTNFLITLPLA